MTKTSAATAVPDPLTAAADPSAPATPAAAETLAGWRAATARRVFLRSLRLEASIGVHPHERRARQPVVLSLDLRVDDGARAERVLYAPPPQPSETVARSVVCYESLSGMVRDIIADGHIDYVETLAERVAARCLEDDRVLEVSVTVEKPQAIPGAEAAGVEIRRRR